MAKKTKSLKSLDFYESELGWTWHPYVPKEVLDLSDYDLFYNLVPKYVADACRALFGQIDFRHYSYEPVEVPIAGRTLKVSVRFKVMCKIEPSKWFRDQMEDWVHEAAYWADAAKKYKILVETTTGDAVRSVLPGLPAEYLGEGFKPANVHLTPTNLMLVRDLREAMAKKALLPVASVSERVHLFGVVPINPEAPSFDMDTGDEEGVGDHSPTPYVSFTQEEAAGE